MEFGAMDIHQAIGCGWAMDSDIVVAAVWVLMSLCPCVAAQATQISMALGETNMVARGWQDPGHLPGTPWYQEP